MALVAPDIQNLVCNLPSFESLCQPNHQLTWIGYNTDNFSGPNANLKMTLDIMHDLRVCINHQKAEVQTSHFLLPRRIRWTALEHVTKIEVCIGKDEDDLGSGEYFEVCSTTLDGIYRLLRNVIHRKCLAFLHQNRKYMSLRQ